MSIARGCGCRIETTEIMSVIRRSALRLFASAFKTRSQNRPILAGERMAGLRPKVIVRRCGSGWREIATQKLDVGGTAPDRASWGVAVYQRALRPAPQRRHICELTSRLGKLGRRECFHDWRFCSRFSLGVFAAPAFADDLDAILSKAAAGKKAPGAGLLIIQDYGIVDAAVHGVRSLSDPTPVSRSDVWNIGSDGKAMTAVMIARLVDRGVLSWESTIGGVLPDMAGDVRPEYRAITLRQLLNSHVRSSGEYQGRESPQFALL